MSAYGWLRGVQFFCGAREPLETRNRFERDERTERGQVVSSSKHIIFDMKCGTEKQWNFKVGHDMLTYALTYFDVMEIL